MTSRVEKESSPVHSVVGSHHRPPIITLHHSIQHHCPGKTSSCCLEGQEWQCPSKTVSCMRRDPGGVISKASSCGAVQQLPHAPRRHLALRLLRSQCVAAALSIFDEVTEIIKLRGLLAAAYHAHRKFIPSEHETADFFFKSLAQNCFRAVVTRERIR